MYREKLKFFGGFKKILFISHSFKIPLTLLEMVEEMRRILKIWKVVSINRFKSYLGVLHPPFKVFRTGREFSDILKG